jgi:diacylglycerol O-acyltransferase / wax synthase
MRMSDAEAIMWAVEKDPALRSDFTNVTIVERPPEPARVRAKVEEALEAIPRLGDRVVAPPFRLAPPEWVPDRDFDLDYHLRTVAVPAPGGMRQLLDLAAAAAATPLDRSRPLWEFTVVEGLEGGRAAFLQKVHHTITDGVGGVKLSLSLLDFEPDPPAPPEPSASQRVAADAEAERLAEIAADPVNRVSPANAFGEAVSYTLRQQLGRARRGLGSAARVLASPESARRGVNDVVRMAGSVRRQLLVTEPARSPLLDQRSLALRFERFEVPLARAKAVAAKLGGSVNDVYVTGVTGALGLYHERMGAPCDELRMAMPISTRGDDEDSANSFTPSRVVVPVQPKDPVARFKLVHERLRGLKDEPAVTAAGSLAGLLTALPTTMLVALTRSQAHTIDFATSNLRGSPVDLYLAGARIEANYPMGPRAACALNITLLSYRDSLDMGLNIDPAAVSDPATLLDCFDESFGALLDVGDS